MAEKYNKLKGAHILLFGGSSGVGYCVAEACLASSARVTISSSTAATTEAAVASLRKSFSNSVVEGIPCDMSEPQGIEDRFHHVFQQTTNVDHIVFTAGDVHHPRSLENISYESIQASGQIRFMAPLLMAKVARTYLKPGPASSITLTNGYVFERPVAGWVQETAWAGAISSLVRGLAVDMQPIRVNLVSLGVVDTPLLDKSFPGYKGHIKADQESKVLTGEFGRPEDVAEAYLGLMKNRNATGAMVMSDAGVRFV